MGELLGDMEAAILGIVSEMRAGNASATPADEKDAGFAPCEYCAYRVVCRKEL
ncbi:MAG: PD-(D/E)XK nuclease family protein [Clostridia bacterium]|nr:PD-(D/E)XK nuclease family protein [Clostridia bacterium]